MPDSGQASGTVVICPTLGLEAMYSYWSIRELANRLAEAGLVALRFDYDGTGDSSGKGDDPDRVPAWLGSVRTAIDYAHGLGVGRLAVVGLRLGATLAVAELAQNGPADDLVLWDPCASGKSFLREQRALWAFLRSQAVEWGVVADGAPWDPATEEEWIDDGSIESPGLVFEKQTVADLEPLSIADSQGPLAERVFLLTRGNRKPETRMAERLRVLHADSCEIEGQAEMLEVSAVTPQKTLDEIVRWLSAPSGPPVTVAQPRSGTAVVGRGGDGGAIVERPVVMGTGQLFGVLTEPEGGPVRSLPTALFFDAGRINHVGPGRIWVEMARKLGREGFRSLRFDLGGIGDSPTRPGRTDLVEYPSEAVTDIGEVRRSISVDDETNFVLIGVCSGGYHAIESALAMPVRAICAINPVLAFYSPGDPSERNVESPERGGPSARLASSSTRRWALSIVRVGLTRHALRRMPQGAWWVMNRIIVKAIPAKTIECVTALGVDVFVVAGLYETRRLLRGEQRTIRSLLTSGRLRIETIPRLEHSLFERTGREHVADVVFDYVVGRFAASSPQSVVPGSDAVT